MSEELKALDELAIPKKVVERLVELLDYKSRRTCRSVCKTLKRCVDKTGLSVKIDSRRPESVQISQSVSVTEAVIIHLETLDWSNKYLEHWKTVIISGLIDGSWFTNGLQRNCTNLRVLIIHEKCIVSQDFVQPSKPLPIFDHLTQLQIFLSKPNFMNSIVKHADLTPELKAKGKPPTKIYKKISTRIHKNIIHLLKTIRSRVLKVLHVTAFAYVYDNKKPKVRWEHEPLFEFIQDHRSTLEEVIVPKLMYEEPEFEESAYKIPCKLQTLVLNSETILTYWKTFLLNQDSLQNLGLKIGLESRPVTVFYFILLNSVLVNNARTLVRIGLIFSNPVSLNMKLFNVCQTLECISVFALADVNILNLNQLPVKSLTTLSLNDEISIAPDFDGLQFLKECCRLKDLSLMGLTAPFTDPKYMLKFVKLALRCRTLSAVHMVMKRKMAERACRIFDPAGLMGFLENLNPTAQQSYKVVSVWDVRNLRKEVKKHFMTTEGDEYVVSAGSLNMSYLEIMMGRWMYEGREQPLNLPRKAESYTTFENLKTGAFQFQARNRAYHERVSDLELIYGTVEMM